MEPQNQPIKELIVILRKYYRVLVEFTEALHDHQFLDGDTFMSEFYTFFEAFIEMTEWPENESGQLEDLFDNVYTSKKGGLKWEPLVKFMNGIGHPNRMVELFVIFDYCSDTTNHRYGVGQLGLNYDREMLGQELSKLVTFFVRRFIDKGYNNFDKVNYPIVWNHDTQVQHVEDDFGPGIAKTFNGFRITIDAFCYIMSDILLKVGTLLGEYNKIESKGFTSCLHCGDNNSYRVSDDSNMITLYKEKGLNGLIFCTKRCQKLSYLVDHNV